MPKSKYATSVEQAIDNEIAALRAASNSSAAEAGSIESVLSATSDIAMKRSASPTRRKESGTSRDEDPFSDVSSPSQSVPPPAPYPAAPTRMVAPAPYSGDSAGIAVPPIPSQPAPTGMVAPAPSRIAQQSVIVASLDERIARLEQVRRWIGEDGEMARFLDAVIGQQVKASERRTVRVSIALAIVSLIAGWALSLLATPQTLATLLHR